MHDWFPVKGIQDRLQYTCNLTLRQFVEPLLQWKSNEYYTTWVCAFVALKASSTKSVYAILSSVVCPAVQYFSTFAHKWRDCWKIKLLNTNCVFSLQRLSATFIILRRNEQGTGWHKKTRTFEKPNKNWRNPRKKENVLTEIKPLQLAF